MRILIFFLFKGLPLSGFKPRTSADLWIQNVDATNSPGLFVGFFNYFHSSKNSHYSEEEFLLGLRLLPECTNPVPSISRLYLGNQHSGKRRAPRS